MTTSLAPVVWFEGKKYKIIKPAIADPDHWVRMIPVVEKTTPAKPKLMCEHTYSVFYKGDRVEGQRCTKCGKQEWF